MRAIHRGSLRFTVLSYNLMGLSGRLGRRRICQEISRLSVHAAGLQEVRSWLGGLAGDNHRALRAGLGQGYAGTHGPGSFPLGIGRSGQSSFFAYPLLAGPAREHELSRYWTRRGLWSERRSVLFTPLDVRLRTEGGAMVTLGDYLGFYNVHLTNRGAAARRQELQRLLELMHRQRGMTRHQLLVGDLNFYPDSPEHRALLQDGFSDVAAGVGTTFDRRNTEVKPGDPDPSGRLDYVLLRTAEDHPDELSLRRARRVLDQPIALPRARVAATRVPSPPRDGGGYHLSDHFGVAVELGIRDPAR